MRKYLEKTLVLIALLVLTSVVAEAKTIKVAMLNTGSDGASQMVFEPDFIEAAVGDTIDFVITDKLHQPTSLSVPSGQAKFGGEVDEHITVKLTKAGVIPFECKTHSILGMAGVIQVGGSKDGLEAAEEAVEEYVEALAMNQDRIKNAMAKVK